VNKVKRNIFANYAGTIVSALLSLVFVPIYIHFLGVESYGLLGVFATLTAIFAPLDAGLGATVARTLAVMNAVPERAAEMRTMIRTMEVLYWTTAVVIGALIVALAPLIATRWLRGGSLSPQVITSAIMAMGGAAAVRWPMMLYSGGLSGLQQQITGNVILVGTSAIAGIGGVAVLSFISPTMTAFMLWQLVVFALQTGAAAFFLYRRLPQGEARFDRVLLGQTWRAASGLGVISIIAMLITQVDKIVLSRLVPLNVFGFYTIATVIAAHLYRLGMPVSQALFPRFSELFARGDEATLRATTYHRGAQLVSALLFPVAATLALFSSEVLLVWTRRADVAANSSLTMTLLVAGTAVHMLMLLPWQLQLAAGMLRLTLIVTSIEAAILISLVLVLGRTYGGAGAATAWLVANLFYMTVTTFFMHRRLLRGELKTWYWNDVGRPLVCAVALMVVARLIIPSTLPEPLLVAAVGFAAAAAALATAMTVPPTREMITSTLRVLTRRNAT
jgi:O-antigen/teichoic acid export membrane protein